MPYNKSFQRLALGTAQFGMDYGVTNSAGKTSFLEAETIVGSCRSLGVKTIDTAIVYGNSERCLGEIGIGGFDLITKLPKIPSGISDIRKWVIKSVRGSLERLNLDAVHGVLLHHSSDLAGTNASDLVKGLDDLKYLGLSHKIGVSVYTPAELDVIGDKVLAMDIVQAPFNVFDQRLEVSGWLLKLKEKEVEIHVRSVFLQGILLAAKEQRSAHFFTWNKHFEYWNDWLVESGQSALEACLNFVYERALIDKIIVGVEGKKNFDEIIAVLSNTKKQVITPEKLAISDELLINPSNWRLNV